jgi:hypothetical protein
MFRFLRTHKTTSAAVFAVTIWGAMELGLLLLGSRLAEAAGTLDF